MINNLLNDPLKLSKNGSSEMGQDMKFLMIDMSPPGNDDDVSPLYYPIMSIFNLRSMTQYSNLPSLLTTLHILHPSLNVLQILH